MEPQEKDDSDGDHEDVLVHENNIYVDVAHLILCFYCYVLWFGCIYIIKLINIIPM